MKKLFFVLILELISNFSEAKAADMAALRQQCLKVVPSPHVTIKASSDKLHYDYSKTKKYLEKKHIEQGGKIGFGSEINGLSTQSFSSMFTFGIDVQSPSEDVYCYYLRDVELEIIFQKPTIYIAKEINGNSCQYSLAVRHEQTHQQINAEVFAHYMPIIKDKLIQIIQNRSLVVKTRPVDEQKVKEAYKKFLSAVTQDILEKMDRESKQEQLKLDSDINYEYETGLCRKNYF